MRWNIGGFVFVFALGILAAPLSEGAQQPAEVPRVGIVVLAASPPPSFEAFRQGLRQLG
jgi:hypothetical protein